MFCPWGGLAACVDNMDKSAIATPWPRGMWLATRPDENR